MKKELIIVLTGILAIINVTKAQPAITFMTPPAGATECLTTHVTKSIVSDGHGDLVDIKSCYMPNANTQVWSIERPNVTKNEVEYPEIAFKQGDVVSIAAGGGVQTGGHGLTWKRYVRPIAGWGGGDDNNYYGSISIPGVIPTQKLSSAIQNGPFTVNTDPGQDGFLRLQYKDDNYDDNGYWGRDDGWYEQCKDMEDAWVVIIIKHNCAGSTDASCAMPAPMDLVADNSDVNGLPQNPVWGWQKTAGIKPQPSALFNFSYKSAMDEDDVRLGTRQSTQNDTYGLCVFNGATWGNILGHINWQPAVYTGAIGWGDHGMLDRAGDDDYNLHLWTRNEAGYTTENGYLQLEFKANEVIDRAKSKWWNSFHQAVDKQDKEIRSLGPSIAHGDEFFVDKKTNKRDSAIVIGLVGLDFEHGQGLTELHPVYVFAIHTNKDPNDDTWAFFARNWGGEGFCSQKDHPLSLSTISFILPPPLDGYSNPQVLTDANQTEIEFSNPGMSYALTPTGSGGNLTLTLLSPENKSLIDGEIHMKWQAPSVIVTRVFSPLTSTVSEINLTTATISNSQLITITNPNDSPLQLGQINIDGANSSAFELNSGTITFVIAGGKQGNETCSNTLLPPNGSCYFRLVCTQGGSPDPISLNASVHIPVPNHPDLIIPVQAQQYRTMRVRRNH